MINPKKMSQMMKQAQQMQKKMSAVQETLEDLVVEGVAGDGLVKVKMDGNQKSVSYTHLTLPTNREV